MKKLLSCFFVFLIFLLLSFNACAESFPLSFVEPTEKEKDQVKFSFSVKEPIFKEPFDHFDVSDDGDMAFAFSSMSLSKVIVYDAAGEHRYTCHVSLEPSIRVQWVDDDLWIIPGKGMLAIVVDDSKMDGRVMKIENTDENWEFRDSLSIASKITVNGQTYIPRKTLAIDNFHRLICKDATGEKNVVYDATMPGIIVRLLVSLIVLTVLFICFKIKRSSIRGRIRDWL